jgi:hypothetical protein
MTMKLATSLLALGSAMAFAPSSNTVQRTQSVKLSLWGEPNEKEGEGGPKSQALPFAPRPKLLDGTMAGDVGFEYVPSSHDRLNALATT